MTSKGMQCAARLAMGDPATELVRVAAEEQVDLIAMSTHGHRFLQDLLRGSTADRVRHHVSIPVLMVRAK
jgi:nucleotide-binding universal stress UspA family protein